MTKKINGKIKFFNKDKGFGFIEIDGEDKDMFFGASDVVEGNDLKDGDIVSFEVGENRKGKKAVEVEKNE